MSKNRVRLRQPESEKPFSDFQAAYLANPSQTRETTTLPLRPAKRSATSLHTPKKGCAVREVCEADLHVGVAFLLPEPVFVICASGFCIQ